MQFKELYRAAERAFKIEKAKKKNQTVTGHEYVTKFFWKSVYDSDRPLPKEVMTETAPIYTDLTPEKKKRWRRACKYLREFYQELSELQASGTIDWKPSQIIRVGEYTNDEVKKVLKTVLQNPTKTFPFGAKEKNVKATDFAKFFKKNVSFNVQDVEKVVDLAR